MLKCVIIEHIYKLFIFSMCRIGVYYLRYNCVCWYWKVCFKRGIMAERGVNSSNCRRRRVSMGLFIHFGSWSASSLQLLTVTAPYNPLMPLFTAHRSLQQRSYISTHAHDKCAPSRTSAVYTIPTAQFWGGFRNRGKSVWFWYWWNPPRTSN